MQICQHFRAKFLCTVTSISEAEQLSAVLKVDPKSITILLHDGRLSSHAIQTWLSSNKLQGFDIVFNPSGRLSHSAAINFLTVKGCYIHNQTSLSEPVTIPVGAPTTHIINLAKLIQHYPSDIASTLSDLFLHHISMPFQCSITSSYAADPAAHTASDVRPSDAKLTGIEQCGQLFNPRKSYLLIGGSSELGVRIAHWMAKHGAQHILLTSRRGSMQLSKPDLMILHHLRSAGVSVEAIAANALSQEETVSVINGIDKVAPVGGIFLMTLVLRDGTFAQLNQESFNDVYLSKVHALNTLLTCIDPTSLDFLLLFSTIGSVFGNAGQATYCASQSCVSFCMSNA